MSTTTDTGTTARCAHCGGEATVTIRLERFDMQGNPDPSTACEAPYCPRCLETHLAPMVADWRKLYEPPVPREGHLSAAPCSNPACDRSATTALYVLGRPAGSEPSLPPTSAHALFVCDECLGALLGDECQQLPCPG